MNIVKSDYESVLELERLFFEETRFTRNDGDISNLELNLNISKNAELLKDRHYKVSLMVEIADKDKLVVVYVKMVGYFVVTSIDDSEFTKILTEKNAIAIMFPFLRSQVSLLTTQPDMKPIIIPPINVNSLIDEQQTTKK